MPQDGNTPTREMISAHRSDQRYAGLDRIIADRLTWISINGLRLLDDEQDPGKACQVVPSPIPRRPANPWHRKSPRFDPIKRGSLQRDPDDFACGSLTPADPFGSDAASMPWWNDSARPQRSSVRTANNPPWLQLSPALMRNG
jgi:hypothetical protein